MSSKFLNLTVSASSLRNNGMSGNDYEFAVSQVEQLKQRLQLANNKVKYGTLVSPATGYVQAVDYSEKEMVNAGTSVVTIMDMNHLEIECDISRQHYENIKTIQISLAFCLMATNTQFNL